MSQKYLPTRILIGRVIEYYEKVNNPGVTLREGSNKITQRKISKTKKQCTDTSITTLFS